MANDKLDKVIEENLGHTTIALSVHAMEIISMVRALTENGTDDYVVFKLGSVLF